MAAAATAADLGIDFMLCEKSGSIQRSRHWFGAINTKYTEAAGAHVDEGRLLNEFSRYASGQCDQRVIRVWIERSRSASSANSTTAFMLSSRSVSAPPMNASCAR